MSLAARNARFAGRIAASLAAGGVRDAVVSPGSRSTPLVLGLRAQGLRLHTVLDERVAGFVALGLARAQGRPVALLCTSGSAGAHYLPALIEARQGRLPVVVFTANRPPELHGCGAPQTIDQAGLFGSHALAFRALGPPADEAEDATGGAEADPLAWVSRATQRLVALALGPPAGPVHLDVAFRQPLWEPGATGSHESASELGARPRSSDSDSVSVSVSVSDSDSDSVSDSASDSDSASRIRNSELGTRDSGLGTRDSVGRPGARTPELQLAGGRLARFAAALAAASRGVIVCGPRAAGSYPALAPPFAAAVARLAQALGWPLIAEPASGVRYGPHDRSALVASADALLRDPSFAAAHRPRLALRFGQAPTSKPTLAWLRGVPALAVDPHGDWHDPLHTAEELLAADPTAVCAALLACLPPPRPDPDWLPAWRAAEQRAQDHLADACRTGLWEGAVARVLSASLPGGALLHVASSMPIRDLDAFSPALPRAIAVTANRGANGIDGTLSTAWGQALAWPGPVTVLVGDLAFLHDAGGLLAARGLGVEATVVVIANGGGGIFELLPIAAHPDAFQEHFLTPQSTPIAALCHAAGAAHRRVQSLAELRHALRPAPGLRVVEVPVERAFNLRRHRAAWRGVARAGRREELACLA